MIDSGEGGSDDNNIDENEQDLRIGCVVDTMSPLALRVLDEIMNAVPNVQYIPPPFTCNHDFHIYESFDEKNHNSQNNNDGWHKYDVIVALGGDGLMLKALHHFMHDDIPIYGINCGHVGFLLNNYHGPNIFLHRLKKATSINIRPLEMQAIGINGDKANALAVNEISLLRATQQSAKLKIDINGNTKLNPMFGDGIMIATPTGSGAYNLAAGGPILPIDTNALLLTPINPYRPRRWRGAILSQKTKVTISIMEEDKRSVNVAADSYFVFNNVSVVHIRECRNVVMKIKFDDDNLLNDKVLDEQFMYV